MTDGGGIQRNNNVLEAENKNGDEMVINLVIFQRKWDQTPPVRLMGKENLSMVQEMRIYWSESMNTIN